MSNITTTLHSRVLRTGLVFMITGLGCASMTNRVRIEPGDAPNKPVFVLTDTTGRGPVGTVYGLSVIPCGTDSPVWQLVATGTNGSPSRVVYGDSVPGYVARIGPVPLRAGCYDVYVSDGPRVRFRIDAAGRLEATR